MKIIVPIKTYLTNTQNVNQKLIKPKSIIDSIQKLIELFKSNNGKVLVLTGAGISTDSGIPDYRGPKGTYIINENYRPIFYHEFASLHQFRQRYWARSYLGWPLMKKAKPNISHYALSNLQSNNYIQKIITQNVDEFHQKSGSKSILELHGSLSQIHCLNCGHIKQRSDYQSILSDLNPKWNDFLKNIELGKINPIVRPDGDIDLPHGTSYDSFNYLSCIQCSNGIYKPSVIFFGENIKNSIKNETIDLVQNCKSILVIGSSLATYSAFRIVKLASDLGKDIAIINLGETRGDNLSFLKIDFPCGDLLPAIADQLTKL
ncbi:DHS-like NAD/FAD-binding domain-containing protein [Gigaspora margarita]|uniref:DHS-like NAD/FAD-binding domain-containing protein n=2 Tax=Gigaspora margarita TaxID=4874 RepID=A0A8H3WVK6_GIGMA|nr:DHS-like NAD/FAD-binding domain-containing protein [Gigaspora margarita]